MQLKLWRLSNKCYSWIKFQIILLWRILSFIFHIFHSFFHSYIVVLSSVIAFHFGFFAQQLCIYYFHFCSEPTIFLRGCLCFNKTLRCTIQLFLVKHPILAWRENVCYNATAMIILMKIQCKHSYADNSERKMAHRKTGELRNHFKIKMFSVILAWRCYFLLLLLLFCVPYTFALQTGNDGTYKKNMRRVFFHYYCSGANSFYSIFHYTKNVSMTLLSLWWYLSYFTCHCSQMTWLKLTNKQKFGGVYCAVNNGSNCFWMHWIKEYFSHRCFFYHLCKNKGKWKLCTNRGKLEEK